MPVSGSDPRLAHSIVLANTKGGVGKTSLCTHIGAFIAGLGQRVLIVDLDPASDMGLDLGYGPDPANLADQGDPRNDAGQSIVNAVFFGQPFNILRDVRPNLDVIPGGLHLGKLNFDELAGTFPAGENQRSVFAAALAEVAGDYDVILIDTPPQGNAQACGLTAGRYLLIPVDAGGAGAAALQRLGPDVARIRDSDNPALTYLGFVIFNVNVRATAELARIEAMLHPHASVVPTFATKIRNTVSGAAARRQRRLVFDLANEYDPERIKRERLEHFREGTPLPYAPLPSARSLADDYQNLIAEMSARIAELEAESDVRVDLTDPQPVGETR